MMKPRPVEWHIAAIKSKTKVVGDCWIWQGFVAKNGYGDKQYRGKTVRPYCSYHCEEWARLESALIWLDERRAADKPTEGA